MEFLFWSGDGYFSYNDNFLENRQLSLFWIKPDKHAVPAVFGPAQSWCVLRPDQFRDITNKGLLVPAIISEQIIYS